MPDTDKSKLLETTRSEVQTATAIQPLIFISHDSRDSELAEAFSKLLSGVSAGVLKSFRSSDRKGSQGIEYGVEWYPELMSRLTSASDVVCLLTSRSLGRPWILYEAGVAKGKLNTPVYGVALGIPLNRANMGPFAQFQNCDDDEESLTKLVMQLVQKIPGSEPDHDAIKLQVQIFKTRSAKALESLQDPKKMTGEQSNTVDDTSVAKLFEEIKVMFLDLPSRLENRLIAGAEPSRRLRRRRFDTVALDDLIYRSCKGPDDPMLILIIASLLRDDYPWLFEIGMEAYRGVKSGNKKATEETIIEFQHAIELTMRSPFLEEIGGASKESYNLLSDMMKFIDYTLHRFLQTNERVVMGRKKANLPENAT